SLASHVDETRGLGTVLAEQESLKLEMGVLRDMIESRGGHFDDGDEGNDGDVLAWSMAAFTVGEPERVDEEGAEHLGASITLRRWRSRRPWSTSKTISATDSSSG
ncbi:hypothetical protein F5887DRAFT_887930, partial [Amanita rubescens]